MIDTDLLTSVVDDALANMENEQAANNMKGAVHFRGRALGALDLAMASGLTSLQRSDRVKSDPLVTLHPLFG